MITRLLIRARYITSAATLALLAWLVYADRHATYEQSIQSFFADDDPAVISYRKAARSFGNDQFVFVAYDDPQLLTPSGIGRVAELAKTLGPTQLEGVIRVESLDAMPILWQLDDQLLLLERMPDFLRGPALKQAKALLANSGAGPNPATPTLASAIRNANPTELADLRHRITAHPLLKGTLIDGKGTTTALVVRMKNPEDHDVKGTIRTLRESADAFAARHQLPRPAIVGPPALLADGFAAIERDGRHLAIAGMAMIALVTLTATGSLWWAAIPTLAGWVVWLLVEAVLGSLGIKLALSGGPIVAQIIVLTMPAASHLAIHFRDELRRDTDRRSAAALTLRAVASPILWCAVTGAIGYGALMTSNVVPVRQFGTILAGCTVAAALLTMALAPIAMLPPLRLEWAVRPGSTSPTGNALGRLTALACRHPAPIVLGVLLVVLPLIAGAARLRIESNYINAFRPDSRVVQDYRFVESRLGGIGLVELVVPLGTSLSPKDLAAFAKLDRDVSQIPDAAGAPAVSQVVSLATVLDPDAKLAALPEPRQARALRTKLELIDASPQRDLLNGFWDRRGGWARILVRVSEQQPAPAKEATFDRARQLASTAFGPRAYLTGLSYLLTQTTRGVIDTQWNTIGWAVGGIFLMLTLAFRGPKLALLAILPTVLAVGLVLGLMGWTGVKLDLATALVASVALGLSVDDTFHCLLQYRRLRRRLPFREALTESYAVTGPGVLLSSIAVALGFAVLRFSEFAPFALFGTMVCIATAGSSLGNLVLLPACLSLGRPREASPIPPLKESSTPARARPS